MLTQLERLELIQQMEELDYQREAVAHELDYGNPHLEPEYTLSEHHSTLDNEASSIARKLLLDAKQRLPKVALALADLQELVDELRVQHDHCESLDVRASLWAQRENLEERVIALENALVEESFEPIFLTVPEMEQRSGLSRQYIHAEINAGRLPLAYTRGRKKYVSTLQFWRWMQNDQRKSRSKS